MAIAYDANDHAVSVDDGTTVVSEALAPSGRVVRRTVRDAATNAVLEDVLMGYADGGDSPSYTKPASGGTITTYLGGVIYTGTTAAWQLTNAHGDVVGTVDAAGAFTAVPVTDEFGVGQTPASRLGWLGGKERFSVGGSLGLVRMGVRLYDPNLGRFTGVDPVEGGSANNYDYCAGEPVNCYDLDGRFLVIGIVVVVVVVAAAGAIAYGASQAAQPEWKKQGLSRCPTKSECKTATKLLKGAVGYADDYGRRLSEKVKKRLRELINNGKVSFNDAPWLRGGDYPAGLFGNRSLSNIRKICKDAYGGNW
jgi:RHS repeat-associated protein